jgi:putative glutamine amidotransferase
MLHSPLIGITIGRTQNANSPLPTALVSEAYLRAVQAAGGIPILIPASTPIERLNDLFARLDGLLFTGGGDIDPQRFDGLPNPAIYDIDSGRDAVELELVRLAAAHNRPFLGICRGIQVINVALGGSLYTDLATQLDGALKHDYYPDIPRDHLAHPVRVSPQTQLSRLLDAKQVEVNSLHHQGLQRLANDLTACAFAPDGLVESVELNGHRFGIGVQWHPEWLQHLPTMRALFSGLIQAAAAQL